jgi:hypothetical protein
MKRTLAVLAAVAASVVATLIVVPGSSPATEPTHYQVVTVSAPHVHLHLRDRGGVAASG